MSVPEASPLPAATPREPNQWVASGRESLDSWWKGYPWYDSATDGVRAVHLTPQTPTSSSSTYTPGSSDALLVISYVVLGLLAGVLGYLLLRFFRNWRSGAADIDEAEPETHAAAPLIEALPFTVDRGRGNLLAEARRLYEAGDFGRAVLYLFAYQLVQLDRHQVIHLARGKTNRQYLREVGPRGLLRPLVERTMIAFEEVFFGGHTLDRVRFESCWSELPRFEELLVQETAG